MRTDQFAVMPREPMAACGADLAMVIDRLQIARYFVPDWIGDFGLQDIGNLRQHA